MNGESQFILSCLCCITKGVPFQAFLYLHILRYLLHTNVHSIDFSKQHSMPRETPTAILIPILKTLSSIAGGINRHADALLSHKKLLHTVCKFLDLPYASRVVYNALWLVSNIAEKNYKQVIVQDIATCHLKRCERVRTSN